MIPTQELLITTYMISALALSTQQKHFMYALLCIEAMMLSLFMMITTSTSNITLLTNMPTPIMLLTMAACEASVGLSLMVATTRTHGSDLLNNLNTL